MRSDADPLMLALLADEALLEVVQRQTFRFFWEGGDPASGLAPDRLHRDAAAGVAGSGPGDTPAVSGGSGFAIMTLIVAVERGWISRAAALERLELMVGALRRAARHHGAWPHFLDGGSGATIPFSALDDGGDLVETAFLCMGLLTARQYFAASLPREEALRTDLTALWESVEWDWYTQGGREVLYWHWSPLHGWAMNHEIRGWNECLMAYLLAAAAPQHPVPASLYHTGFAAGADFRNGTTAYGIELPLGPAGGGPLFFAHYTFCGLDPRGLSDRYADYWRQNCAHTAINRAHCLANPGGFAGYDASCWGLTASDDPAGYAAHAPANDNGTIAPTAALASMPYAPREVLAAMRGLLARHGHAVWSGYGFIDAFCASQGWFAETHLAIDQGPIILMIENHRTGLLWNLFMRDPDVQAGLRRLGFQSPWLAGAA